MPDNAPLLARPPIGSNMTAAVAHPMPLTPAPGGSAEPAGIGLRGPAESADALQISVLGTLDASVGGRSVSLGGTNQRIVFAVLAAHAGRAVQPETLVDAIWPERPPATARHTLAAYVSRLRTLLRTAGDHASIESVCGAYRLVLSHGEVDSDRFEARAVDGFAMAAAGETAAGAELLRQSLTIWRGPAFDGLGRSSELHAHAASLDERRLQVLESWATLKLELREHADVAAALRVEASLRPGREGLQRLLMLAVYRTSGAAHALGVFQAMRTRLVDELGLEPGRGLRVLQQRILEEDPDLDDPQPRAVAPLPAGRHHLADHPSAKRVIAGPWPP